MADLPTPQPKEEPAVIPELTLDLGDSVGPKISEALLNPVTTLANAGKNTDPATQKNTELLQEIRGIREAINSMKMDSSASSFGVGSPDTIRAGHRPRGASLGSGTVMNTVGTGPRIHEAYSTQRGVSTPGLSEWDDYVKSRSLFQPPSGVTQPVTPTNLQARPHSISMPLAVVQAVEQRQRAERAYEQGGTEGYLEAGSSSGHGSRPASALLGSFPKSGDGFPSADRRRTHSDLSQLQARPVSQVYILPPKPSAVQAPAQPVVKTFEELSIRHKEKLKALQDPLSQKTKEEAEISAARNRWERSLASEKIIMSRKEQEASRRDQSGKIGDHRSSHTRSSSALALAAQPSPRPTSTAKVQDWQRHQNATRQHHTSQTDVRAPGRSRSKSPLPL